MIRSFPDSGVLIGAARGLPPLDLIAFNYLDDGTRRFLTSPFVRLETIPKAAYMRREEELAFYTAFFGNPAVEWCGDSDRMAEIAYEQSRLFGLGALDALHISAAHLLGADELVTAERPGKAIYRTTLVPVPPSNKARSPPARSRPRGSRWTLKTKSMFAPPTTTNACLPQAAHPLIRLPQSRLLYFHMVRLRPSQESVRQGN